MDEDNGGAFCVHTQLSCLPRDQVIGCGAQLSLSPKVGRRPILRSRERVRSNYCAEGPIELLDALVLVRWGASGELVNC